MNIEEYFREIEDKVKVAYSIAGEARARGLDPLSKVEIPLATSLAGKVIGLISSVYPQVDNPQLLRRIVELEKEYGSLDPAICLKIAEEIAKEKFCKFSSLHEAIDAGIRVAFAYATLGVVASPIEGFTYFKLKKTKKGEDYFCAYFSGPIRSAGGTAAALSLVIIDYLRELFGYAKYDPTETEAKRAITELYDYHERITNLQYLPTEEEIDFLARNLPIQVDGEPSEDREVSNYKDLERIETNLIRSGFCLVLGEGLAQKAQKILKIVKKLKEKGFKISGWDFLEDFTKLHEKRERGEAKESPTYIQDLVAGRPVLGHPSESGAFRLIYGRARNSGYSTIAIHPATMGVLNGFIAVGTQLKIELPTKGAAISVCDSVEGPVVKLRNKSVLKLSDSEQAKKLYKDIEEIIYLGDFLVPYGDFANRNHILMPQGYNKKYWLAELKEARKQATAQTEKKFENENEIDFETAKKISKELKIPLHPDFIYYWSQISYSDLLAFLDWLGHALIDKKIIFPFNRTEQERFQKGKRAMEILGVPHQVATENVILDEETTRALLANLGLDNKLIEKEKYFLDNEIAECCKKIRTQENVLEIINQLSDFIIRDKAGTFIGTRMGRPEKAKLRKLEGSPHVLFPVGEEGGRLRSFQEAREKGSVKADFPIYYCSNCQKETIYFICENCGKETRKMYYCSYCQQKFLSEKCPQHALGQPFSTRRIDINSFFSAGIKSLSLEKEEIPILIKGVRGTSSKNHVPENLAKGFLRALFNLHVNKDGTVRYDATELPLTHFKPSEIGLDIETAKKLGYTEDINGQELKNENQILEIKPHDILLPACPESPDEKADDVFMNLANFIDALLLRFYKLKPFYNLKKREDLIGQIVVCIAPHNCAGVVARIIGFSKVQALLASPYMHAAMRRDCVYPTTNFVFEDSNEIKSCEIGAFVENLIARGARTSPIDSFGTLKIERDKELYALGVDPKTKKLKKKKIKYFIKGKTPEYWVKIKTATGREQTMTPRHKFIYLDDKNNFQSKMAKEIKVGDKIAILKNSDNSSDRFDRSKIFLLGLLAEKLPLEKQKEIGLVNGSEFFKNFVKRIGKGKLIELLDLRNSLKKNLHYWYCFVPLDHFRILVEKNLIKYDDLPREINLRTIFNKKEWPTTFIIDENLASILGYYASEGYSRQSKTASQVCFRIQERSQIEKLVSVIKSVFGVKPSLGENKTKITICSKLVYYLFRYCFETGSKAYEKKVPNIIYNSSKKIIKSYLSAFFDGDGTILYTPDRRTIVFYSVSKPLLEGTAFLITRFGLLGRFSKTGARLPGKKVLERYKQLGKEPKKHILHHLSYVGKDFYELAKILNPSSKHKKKILKKIKFLDIDARKTKYNHKYFNLIDVGDIIIDFIKEVNTFKENKNSYCFEIDWNSENDKNVLWGEQILNARCDGDEASITLLLDVLLNFSREYLPSHRGSTQDAPLVLNARIHAGEVDDMVFDLDVAKELPLELYRAAENFQHPSKVKVEQVKDRLGKNEFSDLHYNYETSDINAGALCSSYKTLATMQEKVQKQMELVEKIRAVNTSDVARLIIERHFIRDIRGNLRKFSMQQFRCVKCNEKYRRPPLQGKCLKCGGRIIFTVSEGSIIKYLQPALDLAEKYNLPEYLKQNLELTKSYIESIFGKETEKQEALKKWF